MKKIISFLSIILILNNIFLFNVSAENQLDISMFTLKVNDWSSINWNVEAYPWDTIHLLVDGENKSENTLNNLNLNFTFFHNNFTYSNPWEIDSYTNFNIEKENISTSEFNPPTDNILPVAISLSWSTYFAVYYFDMSISWSTSDTQLDLTAQFISNSISSNTLSRTIYINSRPHIIDYYFKKGLNTVTSLKRWWEQIDFFIKIKDYNGCENIDNTTVKADLLQLWLKSDETLVFDSCLESGNEAIYKKSGITTLKEVWQVTFSYNHFSALDEDNNQNLANDNNTTFDNEDKKDNLSLEITSAWVPDVTLSVNDNYIWSPLESSTSISYSATQSWSVKVTLWGNWTCDAWTIIQDWTSYSANNVLSKTINISSLTEWINTIYTCFKNDENNIWSANINITKDTSNPEISQVSYRADITTEDSNVDFVCSENWEYRLEKWWNGVLDSWNVLSTSSIDWGSDNNIVITNNDDNFSLWENNFYVYCIDEASNYISQDITITKTTLPPSLDWITTSFSDLDNDYQWIDWRDFTFTWDNTLAVEYEYFESYRLYILPSNIDFDEDNHSHIQLLTSKTDSSFIWDVSITQDSLWNAFISDSPYKMCIAIMWTNGKLSTPWCSSPTTITWDEVYNAKILSAKFTDDTILEITTDTTLDTTTDNHSWSLISFTYNWNTFSWTAVSSIDWDKINITIPSLGNNISATWSNLVVNTGAIRASIGWLNNLETFSNITDGQDPTIVDFAKNTDPDYNDFYSWSINFSYTFWETMKNSYTKFEFVREWWNPDPSVHNIPIVYDNLWEWSHNSDIDLKSLWLLDWVYYRVKIIWEDLAGNYVSTSAITNIKFDSSWPDQVIEKYEVALYWTGAPTLTWSAPSDNSWNGAWVKSYKLQVYNWWLCEDNTLQEHDDISTIEKKLDNLWDDIAEYSRKVVAIDNIWNIWDYSYCSSFWVNTNRPAFSNTEIFDNTINSTSHFHKSNTLKVKANITNTDIDHIWADLSQLTLNDSHTWVLCSSPPNSITCIFESQLVTYSFTASGNLLDWVKHVTLKSQNTNGWNETITTVSSTADSTDPTIETDALTIPVAWWTIWWVETNISWDVAKVSDTIWIKEVKIEYSTWSFNNWKTVVLSTPNNGSYTWDLTSILTDTYKLKFTAIDLASNEVSHTFNEFSIDKTNPSVPDTSITSLNNWEIIKWNNVFEITWSSWSITDGALATNPIKLEYSTNSWASYSLIAEDLPNSWSHIWNIPDINTASGKIRLTAYDSVWNYASDISDNIFIIDSTFPNLDFDYTYTPINWSYISNNDWIDISWTTGDSYLSRVSYKFINITNSKYWNWTIFTDTETWVNFCTDNTNKSTGDNCNGIFFNLKPNTIIDGDTYELILKSTDEAWNETLSIPLEYTWDTVNPNISITTASGSYFKNSINITWTSSDTWSTISSVKIQIKKWNQYWNWSSWTNDLTSLSTNSTDNYTNWNYGFNYSDTDTDFEVIAIAYDSAYKEANSTSESIIIKKDSTSPTISWWEWLFTFNTSNIHLWWSTLNITWDTNNSITDQWSWLKTNPIKLEYYNWSNWQEINSGTENDGSYEWNIPNNLDSQDVKIRLTAYDNIWNSASQMSSEFTVDSTPPTITSVETMDSDIDWQIDWFTITMSEGILDNTINTWSFSISNPTWTITSWETWNTSDDDTFILKFNNIWDTATTPTLIYTKWSLTDKAWKNLEDVTKISVDKAVPRLLSSEIFDTDWNWKLDKIQATFSETLQNSTDKTAWSLSNEFTWMWVDSVSVSSSTVNIILDESTDPNTSTWTMKLNFTSNSNWIDASINQAWSKSNLTIVDKASPTIVNAEYTDTDSDYKVDRVTITYSEDLVWFDIADFTLNWLNKNTASVSNDTVSINITETGEDNDTWVSANFTFTQWNLKDSSNNLVSSVQSKQITDKVPPKLLSSETWDSNGNGKIDFIRLIYSEDLNSEFTNFAWEVENNYNVSGYEKYDKKTIQFNLDEKSDYDSWNKPKFKITSNSSLEDLNWNLVEIIESYVIPTDKVWPVITWARYDESNNKIFFEFSETINESDFTTWNITLSGAWDNYSITSVNFSEKSITLSNETITYWTTEISFKANLVGDDWWNKQQSTYFTKISPPIIINEVMISNNSDNNYIELKNLSDSSVDIWWFTIAWITIPSGATIAWLWYYLISSGSQDDSIINVVPDLVTGSLNLSSDEIALNNWDIDVDYANLSDWPIDKSTPKSMERKVLPWDWKIASNWYTAQFSVDFDDTTPYWTPGVENQEDTISPTISGYFPSDDVLLPYSEPTISIDYSDNIWWVWIDTNSDMLTLYKWDEFNNSWWNNIASDYLDLNWKVITDTKAIYNTLRSFPYGKYKADFSITDKAWNTLNKSIVFYIDQFSYDINVSSINIWDITPNVLKYSENEVILTVKTLWAWFTINMIKDLNFSSNWEEIVDWNNDWGSYYGFWFNQNNWWYDNNNICSIAGLGWGFITQAKDIDTSGELRTYEYKLKYVVKTEDILQDAWIYEAKPRFEVLFDY
jgi:hypothetical protein